MDMDEMMEVLLTVGEREGCSGLECCTRMTSSSHEHETRSAVNAYLLLPSTGERGEVTKY